MAARGGLPVGFVFNPSPEQLVGYFLDAKLSGKALSAADYPQLLDYDIYSDHPRNIMRATRNRRCVQEGEDDVSGYFFTSLKKASANGSNFSRRIKDIGTWLEKADTKSVYDENMKKIGRDKYYKFTPVAESEDSPFEWQMHEYTHLSNLNFALCHITKKVAAPGRIRAKKRSRNSAILGSDYEARVCKQSRVEHGSSECLPSITSPTQHAGHKANNYNLQQQFPPMPHGSEYGSEPTTVDALTTGEIPNIICLDEESDGDVCEAWDPYVTEGGQCDEYGNPEQHIMFGIEATTGDALTQDVLNLSVNEENHDTDVCEVIDPYVAIGGQCDESMNDNPEQHSGSGVEATADDTLAQEILILMSANEKNGDTDVCEVIDPYVAEEGQCDESMNNNPEQHTTSGVETTTDDALGDEILNLMSVDEENDDTDVCEVTDPCIAEGGQCDEYDRVTSQMHSSSSECLNYPEQPTATGAEYSSSVCMNSNDLNLTTFEPQIVEEEQRIVQGTSTSSEHSPSELMEVPQEDSQVSKIQEQAFLLPQSCAGQYNYFQHAGWYDYSMFVGPDPFQQEEEYIDFNWVVDLWA